MRMLFLSAVTAIAVVGHAAQADNGFEDRLLAKFQIRNQEDVGALRKQVADTVAEATALKDVDPDKGIELLRDLRNRMDGVKILTGAQRREFTDAMQPVVLELRDQSLANRRDRASRRLEDFRDFLVVGGYEGRYPGRSGNHKWEPANFISPNGQARLGKLVSLSRGSLSLKFGLKDEVIAPPFYPLIQVFGGFYVYDKTLNHHVFLTNREFYSYVWQPILQRYLTDDSILRPPVSPIEALRVPEPGILKTTVDSGVYFLRSLPAQEPIPGLGSNESPFLDYLALRVGTKLLPTELNRMYPRDLQDRLLGLSEIQWSAAHRAVMLMRSRDLSVSPLFAEILREETDKLLRSEYANFSQIESNRAIFYIFSKLK